MFAWVPAYRGSHYAEKTAIRKLYKFSLTYSEPCKTDQSMNSHRHQMMVDSFHCGISAEFTNIYTEAGVQTATMEVTNLFE